MRRNYVVMIIAILCLAGNIAMVFLFSKEPALTTIWIVTGGLSIFNAGMSTATSHRAGRPIPLNMLRTQEPFLVIKRDSIHTVLVEPLWEPDQIRVVEWLPLDIGEGDVFAVKKDGTVSVVSRHVKEEEESC